MLQGPQEEEDSHPPGFPDAIYAAKPQIRKSERLAKKKRVVFNAQKRKPNKPRRADFHIDFDTRTDEILGPLAIQIVEKSGVILSAEVREDLAKVTGDQSNLYNVNIR